jgi:hypothetical protein
MVLRLLLELLNIVRARSPLSGKVEFEQTRQDLQHVIALGPGKSKKSPIISEEQLAISS